MTTLFLFAHQDDEIGVFHELAEAKRRAERVVCAFLTNGAWAGVTTEQRNAESLKTLASLGISSAEVAPLGTTLAIPDGQLVEHLEPALDGLIQITEQQRADGHPIKRVIMHAWEGGHHDHDAVHLLGVILASRYGLLDASRQFPLYRRRDASPSMTFAAPLSANGPVEQHAIPATHRLAYIRLLSNYRSQTRVIVKLLPHIARSYAFEGTQKLQPVSVARLREHPNAPPMMYEIWKLYSYTRFRRHADAFLDRHLPASVAQPSAPGRTA